MKEIDDCLKFSLAIEEDTLCYHYLWQEMGATHYITVLHFSISDHLQYVGLSYF